MPSLINVMQLHKKHSLHMQMHMKLDRNHSQALTLLNSDLPSTTLSSITRLCKTLRRHAKWQETLLMRLLRIWIMYKMSFTKMQL